MWCVVGGCDQGGCLLLGGVTGGDQGVCDQGCVGPHPQDRGLHTPLRTTSAPPGQRTPQDTSNTGILSMRGRYASYWNAFLFRMGLLIGDESSSVSRTC